MEERERPGGATSPNIFANTFAVENNYFAADENDERQWDDHATAAANSTALALRIAETVADAEVA